MSGPKLIDPDDLRAYSRDPLIKGAADEELNPQIDMASAMIYGLAPEGYEQSAACRAHVKTVTLALAERLMLQSDPKLTRAGVLGIRSEQYGSYRYERYPVTQLAASILTDDLRAILSACRLNQGDVASIVAQPVYTDAILADKLET